ncbi:GspH/FimT family pseudopilin [Niveibacterium terrae]|uniref:GspH/FimT family pseudopilin n=1 Tax=Niveibacterium terrae TaxID=3373598 RepID=UPI003A8CF41F
MKTLARGFSLIELMTVIVILSIATTMAMPAFVQWTRNVKVRTVAESVQNGLRFAKMEAAKRNANVELRFTSAATPGCASTAETSGRNWVVCAGSAALRAGYGDAGGAGVDISSDFASVTFNGLGRTTLANSGQINISNASGKCETDGGDVRCLRILVSTGGKLRMCDPKRGSGDPAGCGE